MYFDPSQDEPIREAMESCRAPDDLQDRDMASLVNRLANDAELRNRFERMQRLDKRIARAVQDVLVPEGARERLLQCLAAARVETTPLRQGTGKASGTHGKSERLSRRWLVVAGATLAAAASLLVVSWWGQDKKHYTEAVVVEEATCLFRSESPPPGQLVAQVQPPADYPFSRDVRALSGLRWRHVSDLLGTSGVAYDLSLPDGSRVTLYVLRKSIPGLDMQPPRVPKFTTAGCSTAAWQDEDLVYVLVVEGEPRAYQDLLRPSAGPIT